MKKWAQGLQGIPPRVDKKYVIDLGCNPTESQTESIKFANHRFFLHNWEKEKETETFPS